MRLLLVEDDDDLAALLALVLRRAGHEVTVVARVAEVAAGARGVDGVISDGVLLDGTVADVLATLGARPATSALPVVVCALRPGAITHPAVVGRLRKPLALHTFVADVETAFAGGPAGLIDLRASPDGDDDDAMERELGERWERALQELDRRAGIVADHGAALLLGEAGEEQRRAAARAAHRAVGLAGVIGRTDLAELAAEAERLLTSADADRPTAVRLCEVAAQLEDGARMKSSPPRLAAPPAVGRGRVAVVDDDVAFTDLLTPRLRAAGLEVTSHTNGREALAALTRPEGQVDVVVLDVDLPGMNGLTLLAGLQAAGTLAATRVVLATVHGNDAELERAFATGVVTHLPKPFELDRVVRVVAQLVTA